MPARHIIGPQHFANDGESHTSQAMASLTDKIMTVWFRLSTAQPLVWCAARMRLKGGRVRFVCQRHVGSGGAKLSKGRSGIRSICQNASPIHDGRAVFGR